MCSHLKEDHAMQIKSCVLMPLEFQKVVSVLGLMLFQLEEVGALLLILQGAGLR